MELCYQLLNFDVDRARAVLAHLESATPAGYALLTTVALGDYSCSYRNHHTMAWLAKDERFTALRDDLSERVLKLLYQLPHVVKEGELSATMEFVRRTWDAVDGFITGDLGVLRALHRLAAEHGERQFVLTANVLNRHYADMLEQRFEVAFVRPMMPRRAFMESDVGVARDIPVYGNMMINSSTFCFHCGDLPTKCDYSCEAPKELIMENETVQMVGRSLTSVNRMDFRDYLGDFPNVGRVSIMDLDLTLDEIAEVAESLS